MERCKASVWNELNFVARGWLALVTGSAQLLAHEVNGILAVVPEHKSVLARLHMVPLRSVSTWDLSVQWGTHLPNLLIINGFQSNMSRPEHKRKHGMEDKARDMRVSGQKCPLTAVPMLEAPCEHYK